MQSSGLIVLSVVVGGLIAPEASGQEPQWAWVVSAGGTFEDEGDGIAVDGDGNRFVTGIYRGIVTFGTTTLTSAGQRDIYVAKLDPAGNYLWAVSGGGPWDDRVYGIAVDGAGNSFVTGYYQGTATFGATTLTSDGLEDVFVAKIDTAGNYLWAVSGGGPGRDHGYGIAMDGAGNSFVTGYYQGTATFGATTLTSEGLEDVFVAKIDTAGNYLWAVSDGGTSSEVGEGVAVDGDGNSVVTGRYTGTAIFGPTTLTSVGGWDVFVAKLDSTGNYLWAVSGGGPSAWDHGYGIAVDGAGNSYVTGRFQGAANFGSTVLFSLGTWNVFVAKLDPTGNYLWAVSGGGTSADNCQGIAVDGAGNSFVTGQYFGNATFGPTTLTSVGGWDVFVAKLDPTGTYLWAVSGGGASADNCYGIAVDGAGLRSLVTGRYQGSATFGDSTLVSAGSSDVFVAELIVDCNGNGVPDSLDVAAGTSLDCQNDGIPDECQRDENDCNSNGVPDECDIADGISTDCDGNGQPDECEFVDCNSNGVSDQCDIADGMSLDCQGDGIPDECQTPYPCACADLYGDGVVDIDDLTAVILLWGSSHPFGDIDGSGIVDVDDLTFLILVWGPCE